MFYFFTWQYVMQHLAGQDQIFFMGRCVYYFRKYVIVNGEIIFFFFSKIDIQQEYDNSSFENLFENVCKRFEDSVKSWKVLFENVP